MYLVLCMGECLKFFEVGLREKLFAKSPSPQKALLKSDHCAFCVGAELFFGGKEVDLVRNFAEGFLGIVDEGRFLHVVVNGKGA